MQQTKNFEILNDILNANYDIDICDKLKAFGYKSILLKGCVCDGGSLQDDLLMFNMFGGDEATFSVVYACSVEIKFHIKMFNSVVKDTLDLTENDIEQIVPMIHHRFSTIYTEAHALAFGIDPLFTPMHTRITAKFNQEFLQLGKSSINQQSKAALSRLTNGNDYLRRKKFSELPAFIVRLQDKDDDFSHITFNPSNLWTLSDDHYYGAIKGRLSVLHKNPTGQAGVGAITRRPNAFIVAHELGWASTISKLGPPFCSI